MHVYVSICMYVYIYHTYSEFKEETGLRLYKASLTGKLCNCCLSYYCSLIFVSGRRWSAFHLSIFISEEDNFSFLSS